jgi:sugar O-acyltransferase (sialic acid O-acetyltransferase NeuD family)
MIIVGAKGFAKELLVVFDQLGNTKNIVFFDNISEKLDGKLFEKFPILNNEIEVRKHFAEFDNNFSLGVGNPLIRKSLSELFIKWGGTLKSVISPAANIGNYNNIIGDGTCIMTGTVITNDVLIGEGSLINLNCTIGHDSQIGSYSELCPGVHISGNSKIGELCFIGTGAVILPGVEVGNMARIGAGAVVSRNVGEKQTVKGIPAK